MNENGTKVKNYPSNYEAEKSLLCCMMIDGEVMSSVFDANPNIFFNERNRNIFNAAVALYADNKEVKLLTLYDYLERNKKSDVDILDYLTEINNYEPGGSNYKEPLEILKRDMLLRRVISTCNEVLEDAYFSLDAEATIATATRKITEIDKDADKATLEHISKSGDEFLKRLNERMINPKGTSGFKTHFRRFDHITNGLQKSDLIILAARPSVGKTSFAWNIVSNHIKHGDLANVVAVFSLEMPGVQLVQRVFSTLSDIEMGHLSGGTINQAGGNAEDNLWAIQRKLEKTNIFIDGSSKQTPQSINAKCAKLKAQKGRIDLVIIDYLQLMDLDKRDSRQNESTAVQVGKMSKSLKILARELDCPVIALSQMSRGIEGRDDKIPKLSDLRDSGAIEQDADIVMFLSREDEAEKSHAFYNVILDIAKHRNGSLAEVRFKWEGSRVKFEESDNQTIVRSFNKEKRK
ncbi:MAG: replicative DNA helicase [Firmicutes bacterium]|nr:replicative DNA helicase [Bacillota bacterium]